MGDFSGYFLFLEKMEHQLKTQLKLGSMFTASSIIRRCGKHRAELLLGLNFHYGVMHYFIDKQLFLFDM